MTHAPSSSVCQPLERDQPDRPDARSPGTVGHPAAPRQAGPFARFGPTQVALGLALLTILHRAWMAAGVFALPPDSATLGLMGLHILEGDRPLFLYGFYYSGAPLAYLIALSFRLFGISSAAMVAPVVLLAGAWVWMSFLLFRALAGPRAGVAAALCFALPDWITAWYTLTPDCSYGAFLFLVTLTLWAAVSLDRYDLRGWPLFWRAGLLGLAAGLSFWTNALALPYLVAAAIPVVRLLARRGFRPADLAPFVGAGLLCLLAASPSLRQAALTSGSSTVRWTPTWSLISSNLRVLMHDALPLIYQWPPFVSPAVRWSGALAVLAGALLGAISVRRARCAEARYSAGLLLLLMVTFLVCYLPHHMAQVATPRYVLPLWTSLVAWSLVLPWARPARRVRLAAAAGMAIWLLCNLIGSVALVRAARPERDARRAHGRALLQAAAALPTRHFQMLGGYFFQVDGNVLTFLARDRLHFVAAGPERYAPAAQAAELEPHPVYVCADEVLPGAQASLAALGVNCETQRVGGVTLLRRFTWKLEAVQAVPAAHCSVRLGEGVRGRPANLTDRDQATAVLGGTNAPGWFVTDLGRLRPLCGFDLLPTLVPGTDLPEHYTIELSSDGTNFTQAVAATTGLPVAYLAGSGVYLGGDYGRIQCRFPATQARYLRFTGARPPGLTHAREWLASELIVFERAVGAEAGDPAAERPALQAGLREAGVRFTACDRWLSAQLIAHRGSGGTAAPLPAFTRYTGHEWHAGADTPPRWRSLTPAVGNAVVVPTALADEQETVLVRSLGRWRPWLRSEYGYYTSFVFTPGVPTNAPALIWNGLFLAGWHRQPE